MAITYFTHTWHVLQELGPWLLLGVAMAGLLHILVPPNFVRQHLGRGNLRNVLKAAILGVPMPLCSCGVIPAAIGLKKEGASDGAAVGFLISTPQTGVDSIAVSAAFLGLPFALFKVVTAFVTGIIGGLLVNATEPDHAHGGPLPHAPPRKRCRSIRECTRELLDFAVNDLLYGIWRWIAIGVLISAAISTFVPQNALANQPWAVGLPGMIVMLLIAMPLYVCATGSVPIAASLVTAGMPTGAALVFLMAGPATNVATLGAVYREFGRRVVAVYVSTIAVGSILLGWLFDRFVGDLSVVGGITHGSHGLFGLVGAALLLALFAWFAWRDIRSAMGRSGATATEDKSALTLTVTGMTCDGCARHVRNALLPQHGVRGVVVDLGTGRVTIRGNAVRRDELEEAVREAGFGLA